MGYRLYFYAMDKDLAKAFVLEPNAKNFVKKYKNIFSKEIIEGIKEDINDDDMGNQLYMQSAFVKDVYSFGKMIEQSFMDVILKTGKRLPAFDNPDNDCIICTEETFKNVIEWYVQELKDGYQKELDELHLGKTDGSLFAATVDRLRDVQFMVNLDRSKPRLTNSWRYERAIFDLVREFKAFDFDKNVLVLYGG